MKATELTLAEWEMVRSSLQYTITKFREYDKYPSEEFKRQRIEEASNLLSKVKESIKQLRRNE